MAISIIKIPISSSPYIAAAFIYNQGGIAPLQIETGRYISPPVEERICRSCNTGQVEDKQHFCVGCPALEEAPLLHILNLHHVDAGALPGEDKFITIMQSPDSTP